MSTIYSVLFDKDEGDANTRNTIHTVLDCCDLHLATLDDSIVKFVEQVAKDAPAGGRTGLMNHTIAFLLCSVFKDPDEVIGIVCNDEKWQKWETLKWFHELSEDGEIAPAIISLYATLYGTNVNISNSSGEEFQIPRTKLPIDFSFDPFTVAAKQGAYGDFAGFLDNSNRLSTLSKWQLDNCYVGVFSHERDGAPEFNKGKLSDFPLLQRACLFKHKEE